MKKYIFLIILTITLLTGCGTQKLKCTKTEKGTEYDMKYTVEAIIKTGRVKEVTQEIKYDEEKYAKQYCNVLDRTNSVSDNKIIDYECDKNKVIINNFLEIEEINDDITRTEFIEKLEKENYICE